MTDFFVRADMKANPNMALRSFTIHPLADPGPPTQHVKKKGFPVKLIILKIKTA